MLFAWFRSLAYRLCSELEDDPNSYIGEMNEAPEIGSKVSYLYANFQDIGEQIS